MKYHCHYCLLCLLLILSCSTGKERPHQLEGLLKESTNNKEGYQLISLTTSDTVTKTNFRKDLQLAVKNWHMTYQTQFLSDFEAAFNYFNEEGVQHLHTQRLDIQNLSDSIALIHEHANSFVHEQAIKGLYLNQLSTLLATLTEVDTLSSELIWFTIDHQYKLGATKALYEKKLYYFPNDDALLEFDPALDHISIYNLHKFKQKSG